jgi:outer membrane immunogenic protein
VVRRESPSPNRTSRCLRRPPPVQSWTGFYLGGNVGWGRANPNEAEIDNFLGGLVTPGNTLSPTQTSLRGNGVIAGIHGGYNWQFAPTWVAGVEADWDYFNFSKSGSTLALGLFGVGAPPSAPASAQISLRDPWSVRGRLGYVVVPEWMVYATGGFAEVNLKLNADVDCLNHCGTPPYSNPGSVSATRQGWVIGGGVEFKPAGSKWIAGLEYLYYGFGGGTNALGLATGINNCAASPSPAGTACANYSTGSFNVQTIRLRLSYLFN